MALACAARLAHMLSTLCAGLPPLSASPDLAGAVKLERDGPGSDAGGKLAFCFAASAAHISSLCVSENPCFAESAFPAARRALQLPFAGACEGVRSTSANSCVSSAALSAASPARLREALTMAQWTSATSAARDRCGAGAAMALAMSVLLVGVEGGAAAPSGWFCRLRSRARIAALLRGHRHRAKRWQVDSREAAHLLGHAAENPILREKGQVEYQLAVRIRRRAVRFRDFTIECD